MPKILIAYYSRTGENYVSGQLKMLKKGNTEVVAEKIAALTGGELFKIEQVKPYATGYNDCIEQACTDQRSNARPAITNTLADPERYDVIYLGYPNYWGTMPMAVFTFLETYGFAGKIIRPFCTHEGSGLGSSLSDICRLCPGATVKPGLAVHGSRIAEAEKTIEKWVSEENGKESEIRRTGSKRGYKQ